MLAGIAPALGQPLGGTATPAAAVVCYITGTIITLTDQTGAIEKWQSSTDNWATTNDIDLAENPLVTGNLTTTTRFRAAVTNGEYAAVYSTDAVVSVDVMSEGGTAASAASPVCSGTGTTIGLSGQTGGIVKWQSSTDNWATTNDINSADNPLATGSLAVNTVYRAVVTNGVCGEAYSTEAGVTVDATPVGGTAVAASSVVCSNNGTSITLTGLTGRIQRWQSSTDNWATTNDINSADNPLATGSLAVNTVYRAVVTNGVCGEVTSTDAAVSVDAIPVGGTAVAGASVVCSNSGTSITLTGLTGGIDKWQSSTDNWATTNDINSADNPLATGSLAVNTVYRAVVTNGVCGEVYSTEAAVAVDAVPVGGTAVAGASVVCSNSGTGITLTGLTGSIDKWQSSTDNWATTNDINSADNPLATGNLAVNTVYRAVVTNGVCGEVYSTEAAVTVDAVPVGGTAVAAPSVVCSNSGTIITLTDLTGGIQRWQSSTDNWATTNDLASTDNPLLTGDLATSTVFRAVVTNGVCGEAYSTEAGGDCGRGAGRGHGGGRVVRGLLQQRHEHHSDRPDRRDPDVAGFG